MKRSRYVGFLAASVSLTLMAGCKEDASPVITGSSTATEIPHDEKIFVSMESCIADIAPNADKAAFDASRLQCITDWEAAQAAHKQSAPRFGSLAECQAEFGAEGCAAAPQVVGDTTGNSGGGVFMPLMMGYLIGNALGNSAPVYRDRSNGYRTTSGASPSTQSRLRSTAAFANPTQTTTRMAPTTSTRSVAPAPQTLSNSTRSRSSGFGTSSTSRGFGG